MLTSNAGKRRWGNLSVMPPSRSGKKTSGVITLTRQAAGPYDGWSSGPGDRDMDVWVTSQTHVHFTAVMGSALVFVQPLRIAGVRMASISILMRLTLH